MTDGSDVALAAVFRRHYRDLVAPLVRLLGSFELAEDVAQESLALAAVRWPIDGVPAEPLAWLRRVARNRALDEYRRRRVAERNVQGLQEQADSDAEASFEHECEPAAVQDDVLRLIFTCCHPSLAPEAQIALTLRTVCGLRSEQVARSFLLKPQTLQQRLVRAKQKIDQAKIPYEIPERAQLPERVSAVLRTIYLVFNEGYGASDGDLLLRRELCDEAIRLAQLLVELLPEQPEPVGLLALMLLHHARAAARLDAGGELVPLDEQDRTLWDRAAIERALPLVRSALTRPPLSNYAIEAAIAALHAQAPTADATDWPQIVALYRLLEERNPNHPVISLNAAVAQALAGDVRGGVERLRGLEADARLATYPPLYAAQGELWRRLGDLQAAVTAYRRAIALGPNDVEQRFLARRLEGVLERVQKSEEN